MNEQLAVHDYNMLRPIDTSDIRVRRKGRTVVIPTHSRPDIKIKRCPGCGNLITLKECLICQVNDV